MRANSSSHWTIVVGLIFVVSSCQLQGNHTIKEGYNKVLPLSSTPVIVWGTHPVAVEAATVWLKKVGLTITPKDIIQKALDQHHLPVPFSKANEKQAMQVAHLVRAKYVVAVETFLKPVGSFKNTEQSAKHPKSTAVYKIIVVIRGLNVKTGNVDWAGMAVDPEAISDIDQKLRFLTWDALSKAWETESLFTSTQLRQLRQYQIHSPALESLIIPNTGFLP
ncbi:MAG: hypothetical protein D6704_00550 [Nitrospirae bacterium]|nr:MAG: hypothetical protein D6704_00550 [Nitrospirota bacterium]